MPGREKQMKNISGVLNRYVIIAKNLRVFNEASRYECVFENYFSFSQPKHSLWVLKRTVSMRRFF